MIKEYIDLKNSIIRDEKSLNETISKGRSRLDTLALSIKECQNSLKKGNGFSQILSSEYQIEMEEYNSSLLKEISMMKGKLEKSKKDLQTMVNKNGLLKNFENYSCIIPSENFKETLLTLVKGHREGTITTELLEKAKTSSLKFKEVETEGKKYMVKDNRTNYSDMIIFNQDNKVLFVKRNKEDEFEPGKYALPGGHVEPAEDPLLSAIREVEEELSLVIDKKFVCLVGIYEDTKVLINYFCTKINDSLTNIILEERELQQYEWIDLSKIGELDLLMNLKDNFENIIEIPTDLLENEPYKDMIATMYGLPAENLVGSGYPI